jgi:hypothetical protein
VRRLLLSLMVVVGSSTITACHELYCNFVEGLTGEPIDCSHDAFPDLPEVPVPSLPPPPSLPTTTVPTTASTSTTSTSVFSPSTTVARHPRPGRPTTTVGSPTTSTPPTTSAAAPTTTTTATTPTTTPISTTLPGLGAPAHDSRGDNYRKELQRWQLRGSRSGSG